jgi:signal peptidase II
MSAPDEKSHLKVVREETQGFSGNKYMILGIITFIVIALDQFTKILVHSSFDLGESVVIFESFFNFTYVRNVGAAFGIFGNLPGPVRQVFFLTVPPLAVLLILMILRSTPDKEKLQIYALSLVCGGALGNYVDRLRFGYVIDFLDFHLNEKYSWPAFNVADISIVTGVMITALFIFKPELSQSNNVKEDNLADQKQES